MCVGGQGKVGPPGGWWDEGRKDPEFILETKEDENNVPGKTVPLALPLASYHLSNARPLLTFLGWVEGARKTSKPMVGGLYVLGERQGSKGKRDRA